jgi:hypothetical protein
MRPSTVLMTGASVVCALGLTVFGVANADDGGADPTPPVRAALLETTVPPTPDHNTIADQLNSIEGKVDKLSPVTKTVVKTTTVTAPPVTTTVTSTVTKTVTGTTTTTPPPTTTTQPGGGDFPLPVPTPTAVGVGGVATPANADKPPTTTGKWSITEKDSGVGDAPHIYDCRGATVGWIEIKANNIVVQNCKVVANSQYGIWSEGQNNIIQNNDIKGLKPTGDGDMNAVTFFGNNTKIQFNTAIDFVSGSPGDSHTDFIQTWVSTSHPTASSDVVIRSNKATGPANPDRKNSIASIHQCVMVEDFGRGGNSGGNSGGMKNWLIVNNIFGDSWNQCIKNDGVDNMVVTKNDFRGSSTKVMEQANGSSLKFFADNKIGSGYGSVGVPVTAGAGPS